VDPLLRREMGQLRVDKPITRSSSGSVSPCSPVSTHSPAYGIRRDCGDDGEANPCSGRGKHRKGRCEKRRREKTLSRKSVVRSPVEGGAVGAIPNSQNCKGEKPAIAVVETGEKDNPPSEHGDESEASEVGVEQQHSVHMRQMRLALDGLRDRRAELLVVQSELAASRAEAASLREQLSHAVADELAARTAKNAEAEALAAKLLVTRVELDEARRAIASLATEAELVTVGWTPASENCEEQQPSSAVHCSQDVVPLAVVETGEEDIPEGPSEHGDGSQALQVAVVGVEEQHSMHMRQVRVALEALRGQRAELQVAQSDLETSQAEASSLREQLQHEVAEERAARTSKAAEADALATQLAVTRGELDESRRASAAQHAVTRGELDEARRAIASVAAEAELLESKLASAEAEAKSAKQLGRLQLAQVRSTLEMRMKAVWQHVFQELDDAPHRTYSAGPSVLRASRASPRLPGVSPRVLPVTEVAAMAGGTTSRSGGTVRFVNDQALVSPVSVTSYRDLKESLWVPTAESSVMCDKCEKHVPQTMGVMRKMAGRPQFMNEEFLCAECSTDEARASARAASSPPRGSPSHRTSSRSRSRSISSSSNSSSIPRSDTSPSASPASRRRLRRGRWPRGDGKQQSRQEGGPMKRKHEGKRDKKEGKKKKKRLKEKPISQPEIVT